jgi:hypothetical protein
VKIVVDPAAREALRLNRSLLIGGGVLLGVGGLVGFAGVALLSSALISVTKQWVDQLDQSPTEIAKQRWQQTKAAANAGASAWKNGVSD